MNLGVNNRGKFEAFATYVAIFIANLLWLLPKGVFPTWLNIYEALGQALFSTIIIWLANKGVEWRTKK